MKRTEIYDLALEFAKQYNQQMKAHAEEYGRNTLDLSGAELQDFVRQVKSIRLTIV